MRGNLHFPLGHLGNFLQENFFHCEGHQHYVICRLQEREVCEDLVSARRNQRAAFPNHEAPHLVIDVAVGEHGVEVLHTFTRAPIVVVLEPFLDGSQVHGRGYYRMIILIKKESQRVR